MSAGKLPRISGWALIKFLCNKLGCAAKAGKGSHAIVKGQINGKAVAFPVPLHPELAPGTLLGILREAGISREEFISRFGKK